MEDQQITALWQEYRRKPKEKIDTSLGFLSEFCYPSLRNKKNNGKEHTGLSQNYGLFSERSFDLNSSWFGPNLHPNLSKTSSVKTVKGSGITFTVLFPFTVKCFDWKQFESEAFDIVCIFRQQH